jgi:hypothetical protein
MSKINLEILAGSKAVPQAGDVFALRPKGHDFYFGRVVIASVEMLDWEAILVYIFNYHAKSKGSLPARADLNPNNLLLPPTLLDPGCWSTGVVETVGHIEMSKGEILDQHCFWDPIREQNVDERRRPIARCSGPCGAYGLTPPRGLDNKISRALGIPEAPD